MHNRERSDADAITDALREFKSRARPAFDWWPRFAYHFTDVSNARSILEHGALLSRNDAVSAGLMAHDNAHQGVITQSEASHGFVRLYFRPLTPTQYRNEGIKPAAHCGDGHCPVPAFFLFHLDKVLRREGTRFWHGGLNKTIAPQTFTRPRDLRTLPAEEIYSSGAYDPQAQWYIKDRRHAEIVTVDPLPLEPYLFGILFRSAAEMETLLDVLTPGARQRYVSWFRTFSKGGLFYRRWPYVESVELAETVLSFKFSTDYGARGIYRLRLVIGDSDSGQRYHAEAAYDYTQRKAWQVRLPSQLRNMHLRLTVDDCLAFSGMRSRDVVAGAL